MTNNNMTASLDDRFFYHSFPRRKGSEQLEIEKGLNILALIADLGLLLTPEVVRWAAATMDGPPRVERNVQTRVCFTELMVKELEAHADIFGRFALEFKVETVRAMGAMPVFYVPRSTQPNDPNGEAFGPTLVTQIMDAKNLLHRVAALGDYVAAPLKESFEYQVHFAENSEANRGFMLEPGNTRSVLASLTYGLSPPKMLRDAMMGILNLFYPADDHHDPTQPKLMAYYRQREWRITGILVRNGVDQMRHLTKKEFAALEKVDLQLFTREIDEPLGRQPFWHLCLVYPMLKGKRIIDVASRVIVPEAALAQAKALLVKVKSPIPVVALESLR
jgi:hypothetical protein